ncbi:MAG: hypothetical protein Q7W13_08720 [Bacteroidia bacterium]|nr:hypothetical protein [Bacteroidia bacterium]
MKKTQMLFTGIACLAITASFCQNEINGQNSTIKKRKLKVVDAAIAPGMTFHVSPLGSFSDFQQINPKSVLLSENMDGYTISNGFMASAGPTFNANLGFNIANNAKTEYKSNTQLRIGITFSEISMSNNLSKTDRKRFDTLTSSQTGQMVFSDSVTYSSYTMNYKTQQLRIDVSIIYRTNPAARWSVFGGIGIEAGESIMAYTDINYSEYSTVTPANSTSGTSYSSNTPYRSEQIINKNTYGYAAYLPMGLDFRIGNKREFFKQLHVFYEARPFVNYTYIPELGSINSVGIKSALGLRVTI